MGKEDYLIRTQPKQEEPGLQGDLPISLQLFKVCIRLHFLGLHWPYLEARYF